MDEKATFIAADDALTAVVQQIADDQWALPIPEWFPIGGQQDRATLTLRSIVEYHALDEAWIPDVLAGRTTDEVGTAHDGDLLGADVSRNWDALVAAAREAVQGADLDATVHLSYGDWPAREFLKHTTTFRGFRAHDIALLIGVDATMPPDLVQGMWDEITPQAEEWRSMGVFGPAIEVPADAPLQDRLLGLSGREPS